MSCADVMYQPYSPYFPYHQRSQATQPLTPVPTQGSADYRKFSGVKPHAEGSPTPSVSPPTEDKGSEKAEAQYLSANCVLFTYYSGDISSVVDEHFARALSQAANPAYTAPSLPTDSKGSSAAQPSKDGPPMSHRNFPPSFWNSNYQPMSNSNLGPIGPGALGTLGPELTYGGDPYHHHPGSLHATLHHQNDPWHYTLTGQPPFSPSYHHATGGPRFAPQYGSLLLQPAVRSAGRLGPAAAACASLEKADSWGASRYHDTIGHVDSNYGAAYGAMTPMPGLEGQPQDSKDLYWF